MTTEEIEKAANEFAEKHGFRVPYDGSNEFYDKVDVRASKDGFKAGAEFVDKHWQEKTRWIPIEERLPIPLPFEDVGEIANGDLLLLKHIGYGSIEFGVLRELNNKKYFELPDCGNCEINEISHWKEIE